MSQNLWAKKFDEFAHIVIDGTTKVYCGQYNALLGNNYAEGRPICPKCQVAQSHYLKPIEEFKKGDQIILWDESIDEPIFAEVAQIAESKMLPVIFNVIDSGLAYFNEDNQRFEFYQD